MLLDHVAVGLEPLAVLDELAALDGPHLHPAAALVVLARHLHGRHHAAEREALDGFHAVLHVLAGGLGPALGLDGVADGFDMQSGDHQASIVEDADLLLLGSRLALRLVHRVDVLDDLEIPANAGKLQRVVALGYLIPASSLDVGLGGAPHQRDHLAQRVALALELLDGDRRRPAEQMRDHEVGLVAPGDVEHLRGHFHTG